jgi:dolichol-phosphate mannosyltransferase
MNAAFAGGSDERKRSLVDEKISVVVPTFNEAPNIGELVDRIARATSGTDTEVLFVDDSTDDTPDVIREVAESSSIHVRLIHRDSPVGGLSGAVIEGLAAADSDVCVVMDGDLQHPPETIPILVDRFALGDVDVVVASRYAGEGSSEGLADVRRVLVSRGSTALVKSMFPGRLRNVSDPMTGFFLVDRRSIDLKGLRPRGFKILLEILARKNSRVAEVSFDFADRRGGESKASLRQGLHFLMQLVALRFGKMSAFALIGGIGALANLLIVWMLSRLGIDYVIAAVVAAEVTIIGNFLLQERFVFNDVKSESSGVFVRFAKSFGFNNAEAIIRIPLLVLLVETWHLSAVVATAATLAVAFIARFIFHSLVVYAPRRGAKSRAHTFLEEIDAQATAPGEL